MEKPGSSRAFIAGVVVGGLLFGAGYLTGRSSREAAGPRSPEGEEDVADPAHSDAPSPPPRARRPRQDVHVTVGVTASPAPAPRLAGDTLSADKDLSVHAGADEASPVVGTIPRGAEVHVIERRAGYRLVARPDDDTLVFGWVLWRAVPGRFGTGTIKGVVDFTGRPPVMTVPRKRKDAEVCKTRDIKDNVVLVEDGKLQDVLVRLANDAVTGDYEAPVRHAEVDQIDCMYTPRIQGVIAGQTIDVKNGDATLHNVHSFKGAESWFNKPQIKGSGPTSLEMPDEPVIIKLTCDVHPWMRAFVVVSAHPFFSVTGADGAFALERVPAGVLTVEAWHPHYGLKTARVRVEEGKVAEVVFRYNGTEPEPAENKDELRDLF